MMHRTSNKIIAIKIQQLTVFEEAAEFLLYFK